MSRSVSKEIKAFRKEFKKGSKPAKKFQEVTKDIAEEAGKTCGCGQKRDK